MATSGGAVDDRERCGAPKASPDGQLDLSVRLRVDGRLNVVKASAKGVSQRNRYMKYIYKYIYLYLKYV